MKKVLLGLLVLGSFSAFAQENPFALKSPKHLGLDDKEKCVELFSYIQMNGENNPFLLEIPNNMALDRKTSNDFCGELLESIIVKANESENPFDFGYPRNMGLEEAAF